MDETKFDWDDLRLFLAVARQGGLAAAAALTGKSPPTLGRRMLSLERRLGLDLFERLPRGYALTEQGKDLLAKVAELEGQLTLLSTANGRVAAPVVKVSAGTWTTHLLCQRVTDLVKDDSIALRFIAADQVLDIGRREAVIGIRNQRPEQLDLAGRRVGKVQFAVYAADSKISSWVRVIGSTPSAKWLLSKTSGAQAMEVTNPRNALDLALVGAARAVLPTFIGDAQHGLQRVTPAIDDLEHEQWLVTHHQDRFLPEVRRTVDRVYATLRAAVQ
ncbi:DNA-binding transcriptional LysR family regulator [Devosia sp. UYZn731]|uniref:LysR family transcriptional regulator n=1 Tax=Devosia sp. UYZn731 TaxID=3156345 RepID=UPI003393E147